MSSIFDVMIGACTAGEIWALSMPNTRGDGSSRHVATRRSDRLERFCKKHDVPGQSTYFCVSSIEAGKSRKRENAVQSAFAFMDLDFKDHDTSPAEILDVLLNQRCPPSRVHSTGGGYHTFWLTDVPVKADQFDRFEALLKRVAYIFGGDPSVTNRVALLRVPGTTNTKREEPKRVTVVRETARRYSLDELEEWVAKYSEPVIAARGVERDHNLFLRTATNQSFKPTVDVEQRLKDMRHKGEGDAAVHSTQLHCTASLMARGMDIDEAVELVLKATQDVSGTQDWNWRNEKREIHRMCADFLKKHGKISERRPAPLSAGVVSLRDAVGTDAETAADTPVGGRQMARAKQDR